MLKALCAQPGIGPQYLLRRVKEVDPGFVCGPLETKAAFSDKQKGERLKFCNEYIDRPPTYWWQWIFMDEFTAYEKPAPSSAIHRRGDHLFATDSRLKPFHYGSYGKLSLCIAVNAYVGLVGWWWIHCTNGHQGKTYYVNTSPHPPTLLTLHWRQPKLLGV